MRIIVKVVKRLIVIKQIIQGYMYRCLSHNKTLNNAKYYCVSNVLIYHFARFLPGELGDFCLPKTYPVSICDFKNCP